MINDQVFIAVDPSAEEKIWSGQWDSNPQHPAWEAGTLPLSYARSFGSFGRMDFNTTAGVVNRRRRGRAPAH
jgi:hypothetical protein